MTISIGCNELGIKDCSFTASGETAGDVAEAVVDHLRAEHDIDMPKVDAILGETMIDNLLETDDPAAALAVQRLAEALDIAPLRRPQVPHLSVGRTLTS